MKPPKARLFYVRRRPKLVVPATYAPHRFAKFRLANAMFVWVGPLEIGWRMPWIKEVRERLYPSGMDAECRS